MNNTGLELISSFSSKKIAFGDFRSALYTFFSAKKIAFDDNLLAIFSGEYTSCTINNLALKKSCLKG